jgi:flagellar biogenesis protein FliO
MLRKSLAIIGISCFLLAATGAVFGQSGDTVVREEKRIHVVKKGELCIEIAKKYGTDAFTLKHLNPGRNLARLQIGDQIVVGVTKASSSPKPQTSVKLEVSKGRPDKVALMGKLEEKDPKIKKEGEPGTIKTAFWMIIKLGVVLILAYLTILALKLLSDKRESSPRTKRDLKLMDTVKLSNTSSLHLVEVGGKTLLIGSSSGQVNLLREMEAAEETKQSPAEDHRFSEYLEKYSGALQKTPAGRVAGLLRDCAVHLQSRKRKIGDIGATSADGDEKT